ncbi:MAG: hypothetical protein Q4G55_08205, partial [bacterium]|nr:hypothetical protein [bacterium]
CESQAGNVGWLHKSLGAPQHRLRPRSGLRPRGERGKLTELFEIGESTFSRRFQKEERRTTCARKSLPATGR